ncbi:major facilitator superfamily domain-containing protein [Pelagophyceae sp. CCMP2097]|nr:major facilitator superfamily domain-containing protein [Pelagophyceae sp. CCMP2097]
MSDYGLVSPGEPLKPAAGGAARIYCISLLAVSEASRRKRRRKRPSAASKEGLRRPSRALPRLAVWWLRTAGSSPLEPAVVPHLEHAPQVLCQVAFGYDVGMVSQCLGAVSAAFELGTVQQGLVTSLLNFAAAGGALAVSGSLLDRFGRKASLNVAAVLLILGGTAAAAAPSFGVLLIGRLFQGLGVGASWSASGTYVTEIAPPHMRGGLVALVDVSSRFHVAPWRIAMLVSLIPPVLFLLAAPWLPESPKWLAMTAAQAGLGQPHKGVTWRQALAWPRARYALVIAMMQQATGTEAILYFAPAILPRASKEAAFLGNLGIGGFKLAGEMIAALLADHDLIGRRTLMILSNANVVLGLACFAASAQFELPTGYGIASVTYVMLAFSLGPGPFTAVFVNETVDVRYRAKSTAIACCANRLTSAIVALSFLPLQHLFGAAYIFYFYALIGLFCTLFYAKTLPHTLGKDLEMLEEPLAPSSCEEPLAPSSSHTGDALHE